MRDPGVIDHCARLTQDVFDDPRVQKSMADASWGALGWGLNPVNLFRDGDRVAQEMAVEKYGLLAAAKADIEGHSPTPATEPAPAGGAEPGSAGSGAVIPDEVDDRPVPPPGTADSVGRRDLSVLDEEGEGVYSTDTADSPDDDENSEDGAGAWGEPR